jgi:hypothetical protein
VKVTGIGGKAINIAGGIMGVVPKCKIMALKVKFT